MASIHPRGDGWQIRWRNPGERTVRSHQVPTRSLALQVQREIKAARALKRPWPAAPAPRDPEPLYLSSLIDAWIVDQQRLARAPRTIERAHAVLSVLVPWATARLGHAPTVAAFSRSLLEAWDAEQIARGNGLATRRIAMWAPSAVWRWGWDHDEWRTGMAPPAIPRLPRAEKRRPIAPTVEQMDAVVVAAHNGLQVRRDREAVRRLVILLRGLGWRVSQCLGIEWPEVDLDLEEIELRGELGKSAWERAGRRVKMASWLAAEIRTWLPRTGLLIGRKIHRNSAAIAVRRLWGVTGAPESLWKGRPDHAFRSGLISELKRARVDTEVAEYYVGHAPAGTRGPYVDPASLNTQEVADAIPAPGVRTVSKERVVSGKRA